MYEEKGKRPKKHKYLFAALYSLVLAAFTAYVMLDTFVLETVENSSATGENTSMFDNIEVKKLSITTSDEGDESSSDESDEGKNVTNESSSKRSRRGRTSDTGSDDTSSSDAGSDSSGTKVQSTSSDTIGSYSDENIAFTITEYYQNDTKIYVADIYLSTAQYLKTAFADGSFGKNVKAKTSETASSVGALLAINGDYYGAREKGYVIRNGIAYRDTASSDDEILCIYADGHFDIITPDEATTDELVAAGVWQAFDFGPALIDDGSIEVSTKDEVDQAMASNPRTAIGYIDDLHYVFVVSDGRTDESRGLSLYELAQFMQGLGCECAYNLDGGGSSTMYYNGEVVNNPTTNGSIRERQVSDIVYLGY